MNLFKVRHFQRDIILWAVRWYWRNPSGSCSWHLDETYIKVSGRWAYLYRAVDSKSAYRFLGKILNNVKDWQIPRIINADKAPTYSRALTLLRREGRCPPDVEHRQIRALFQQCKILSVVITTGCY